MPRTVTTHGTATRPAPAVTTYEGEGFPVEVEVAVPLRPLPVLGELPNTVAVPFKAPTILEELAY
jgi:hypothetical protein